MPPLNEPVGEWKVPRGEARDLETSWILGEPFVDVEGGEGWMVREEPRACWEIIVVV